jgi:hypothetical protein
MRDSAGFEPADTNKKEMIDKPVYNYKLSAIKNGNERHYFGV